MQILDYTLRFTTPAFLGNAEQNAQWRTPPIKALLRQWWRVAYAAEKKFAFRVDEMRREEGVLFGHAWLEDDEFERGGKRIKTSARKSAVRIRLETSADNQTDAWGVGSQRGVSPLGTGLDTGYAWFGLANRGGGLPDRNALSANGVESSRRLLLAIPDAHMDSIREAVRLASWFGQLGSRSRGGWGSFEIKETKAMPSLDLHRYSRSLDTCLKHDWPFSLCADKTGICLWESKDSYPSWDKAMKVIAGERRNVRLELKALNGRDLRPVLGFASPGRMASPLRWRLVATPDGKLSIRVFAMPSLIPEVGGQRITSADTKTAWERVIQILDTSRVFKPRS